MVNAAIVTNLIESAELKSTDAAREQVLPLVYNQPAQRANHYWGFYHQIEDQMKAPAECREPVKKIATLVRDYAEASMRDRNERARMLQPRIESFVLRKQNAPCFEFIARGYALASLNVLLPGDTHILLDPTERWLSIHRVGVPNWKSLPPASKVLFSGNRVLQHLAIAIVNLEAVRFARFSALAPEKNSLSSSVLGAYDCSQGSIYLDPFQAPFNLGASFLHEMSHLFRDKFDARSPIGAKDLRYSLVNDEAVAALHAGFAQRNLTRNYEEFVAKHGFLGRVLDIARTDKDYTYDHSLSSEHGRSEDLSFFNRNGGALDALWALTGGLNRNSLSFYDFTDFLGLTFFRRISNSSPLDALTERRIDEKVRLTYQLIDSAYFSLAASNTSSEGAAPGANDDPLSQISGRLTVGFFGGDHGEVRFADDQLLDLFVRLKSSLQEASPSCREFKTALSGGELSSYVGQNVQFQPLTSRTPITPGENLPTRPEKNPIVLGQEGNQPTVFLRPCLDLYKML
jgi:hypothetical protein